MLRRNIIIPVSLALVIVALTSIACYSAPKVAREFILPAIDGKTFRPRISGDWIVGIQTTEDNKQQLGVIVYNIPKSQVFIVYSDKPASWPSISGNTVACTGLPGKVESLSGTRLATVRSASLIVTDLSSGQYSCPAVGSWVAGPVVCGNYVAYESCNKINLLDLRTGRRFCASGDEARYQTPEIGGDIVVFGQFEDAKHRTEHRQLLMYRISTGQTTRLTDDPASDNYNPRTDGKTVVWTTRSGVEVYDVASGNRSSIPNGVFADVDNDIVVYMKQPHSPTGKCMCGVYAVYGYDLAGKREFRISNGESDQGPSIDGNRVIWCKLDKLYCAELQ